ncbi:MAG: T9SS type A sorting domain-containing protein [Saprospiraceae bacterium]|nr:T9SS type A sorting domain-containing protein [Saprospiraceae bacterium]
MWINIFNALLILLTAGILNGQPYIPGEKYQGYRSFTEYHCGTLPIILSAPHGGYDRPTDIPDRNCEVCPHVNDAFTRELSLEIYRALNQLTGCFPHLIINNLHRSKFDANRNLWEATLGNTEAIQAWNDFHDFIHYSKTEVQKNYGKGLYLDIHGHGHSMQRIELGYLLYDDELRLPDSMLNTPKFIGYSSIRSLVQYNKNGLTHAELLRGVQSFGQLCENEAYPSVPSFYDPFPKISEPYFSGGYNVSQHGSQKQGNIDGIQIEVNQNVRFDAEKRRQFAQKLAGIIIQYLDLHYFDSPESYACVSNVKTTYNIKTYITPNPATDILNLHFSDLSFPCTIYITDTLKKLKFYGQLHHNTVDVSHLLPGMYFITLEDRSSKTTFKFFKI